LYCDSVSRQAVIPGNLAARAKSDPELSPVPLSALFPADPGIRRAGSGKGEKSCIAQAGISFDTICRRTNRYSKPEKTIFFLTVIIQQR
jgi:hypothetical protein